MTVHPIPRLDDAEITEIAAGIVKGRIFTAAQVPRDMLRVVFLPLISDDIDWPNLGNVVEDISKAAELSVNGLPMFLSCRLIHKDDWSVIGARAIKAQEALDAALGQTGDAC